MVVPEALRVEFTNTKGVPVIAYILETVGSAGTRRGGRTYWTRTAAIREAERRVRTGAALSVRVLRLRVAEKPEAVIPSQERDGVK